jgi:CheY-like chemotaxis protein
MAKTILLADDSVTIRKVVELTFSETDIRVESVGSGREALDQIRSIEPDLVLADVAMPEPSGYDICREVKASGRPVPVLLLAGTFEPFDMQRARDCGADGHVVKPFESSTLVEKVESLLSRPIEPPAAEGEDLRVEQDLDQEIDSLMDEAPARTAGDDELRIPESGPDRADELTPPGETAGHPPLAPHEIDAVARAVVQRLSADVLREIAWEVVPELAESIIRERIRQLEREVEG